MTSLRSLKKKLNKFDRSPAGRKRDNSICKKSDRSQRIRVEKRKDSSNGFEIQNSRRNGFSIEKLKGRIRSLSKNYGFSLSQRKNRFSKLIQEEKKIPKIEFQLNYYMQKLLKSAFEDKSKDFSSRKNGKMRVKNSLIEKKSFLKKKNFKGKKALERELERFKAQFSENILAMRFIKFILQNKKPNLKELKKMNIIVNLGDFKRNYARYEDEEIKTVIVDLDETLIHFDMKNAQRHKNLPLSEILLDPVEFEVNYFFQIFLKYQKFN